MVNPGQPPPTSGPPGPRRSRSRRIGASRLLQALKEKSRALEAANLALVAREARLRAIVDTEPECVKLVAEGGALLEMNPAGLRMIEADSLAEVLHRPLSGLVTPEHRAAFEALTAAVFRGESGSLTFEIVGLKGGRRWLESHASPLRDPSGTIVALVAVTRDVTARRRSVEALRESEERFRNMAEHSPLMLWVTDASGAATYVNNRWYAYTGQTPATALGFGWLDALHPDDRALARDTFLAANAARRSFHLAYRLRGRDGRYRHMIDAAAPRFGEGGEFLGYVGSVIDVHERHEAEATLRESEERFRQLAENVDEVFSITDLESRRLIYVNPAFERIFGQPAAALYADPGIWIRAIAAEDRERIAEAWRERSASGYDEEYRIVRPNGEVRWLHGRAFVVGGRVVGVAQDVTARRRDEAERRRLEGQIQHAQKLESLGILAGGIAHDFNNLLTGILGHAELALLEVTAGSPVREPLAKVIEGARRAAELTGQMLAYSGKGRFVVEAVDLSSLTREMARLLSASVSKKCQVRYALAADLPAVEGDAAQLRQVVMNLIINASEAVEERGGAVAVTTRLARCDRASLDAADLAGDLPEGPYVILEVADDGVGMTEATRARIFDPFFTTKFTGRGLGLSAVQGIVRGHRGAIEVESAPGAGTTVRVLLPALPTAAAATAAPAPVAVRGSGVVVVADDEAGVRELARDMLERLGFQVRLAGDGAEALALVAAGPVRLVLLDLTMPRLDGLATLRALRRERADRRDLPVVLMSGYNEERATGALEAGGRVVFLKKPFGVDELNEAINRAFAGDPA